MIRGLLKEEPPSLSVHHTTKLRALGRKDGGGGLVLFLGYF